MSNERVFVALRFRPLSASELEAGEEEAWSRGEQEGEVVSTSSEGCRLDKVFDPSTTGEEVYRTAAQCVVKGVQEEGISGTVFAYGQTGSGKTHTMQEISQFAARELLQGRKAKASEGQLSAKLRFSAVEVYNEELRDLLDVRRRKQLRLLEDRFGETRVANAKDVAIRSEEHLFGLLNAVHSRRTTGQHLLNERSSRSHLVIRLRIKRDDGDDWETEQPAASLHLVDLAGSERVAKTQAEGMGLREGASINRSLLTLGTVLRRLSEGGHGHGQAHAPYRDSKLTRLIAPALGGSARTSVICCASPSSNHSDQTRSTLAFALHARAVVNKVERPSPYRRGSGARTPRKNVWSNSEISRLQERVKELSEELEMVKGDRDARERKARGLERFVLSPQVTTGNSSRRRCSWEGEDPPTTSGAGPQKQSVRRQLSWSGCEEMEKKNVNGRRLAGSLGAEQEFGVNAKSKEDDGGSQQPRQGLWGEVGEALNGWLEAGMALRKARNSPQGFEDGLEALEVPMGEAQEEARRELKEEQEALRRHGGPVSGSVEELWRPARGNRAAALQGEAEGALAALQSKLSAIQERLEIMEGNGNAEEAESPPQRSWDTSTVHGRTLSELSPNSPGEFGAGKRPVLEYQADDDNQEEDGVFGEKENSIEAAESDDICVMQGESDEDMSTPNGKVSVEEERGQTNVKDEWKEDERKNVMRELVHGMAGEGRVLEETFRGYKEQMERAEYQKRALLAQAMRLELSLQEASEENARLHDALREERERAANLAQAQRESAGQPRHPGRLLEELLSLWEELKVTLSHRAKFLLSFQERDPLYLEAEERRLRWLKTSMNTDGSAPRGHPLRGSGKGLKLERRALRTSLKQWPKKDLADLAYRFALPNDESLPRSVAESVFTGSLDQERGRRSAQIVCDSFGLNPSQDAFNLLFSSYTTASSGFGLAHWNLPKRVANVCQEVRRPGRRGR